MTTTATMPSTRSARVKLRRSALAGAALLSLAVLAACGGDGDPPGEATTVGTTVEAATAEARDASPEPPLVGEVVWATAIEPGTNAPIEPADRLPAAAPSLYAVVQIARLPPDSVLAADWSYNEVPLEGLDAEVAISAWIEEATWIEFHLDRDDEPWPVGRYGITINLNGEAVRTSVVEVVAGEAS